MKHSSIVIVTEEFDPHADLLLVLLREMGYDPVRVHPADIPLQATLSTFYDGAHWKHTLTTRRRTVRLDEVRSIWWRRPLPARLPETLTRDERHFANYEIREAVTGMWEALEHTCYWVSFPANIRKASHKVSQLQQATQLGLQVPRTLVSNDPDLVRQFFDTCEQQMIYKTLYSPAPQAAASPSLIDRVRENERQNEPFRMIYTTLIGEKELALLDTVRLAPGLFEEYIPKQVELRVTVIGDDIFAAEFHSQVHEETRIDWRHYEVETPIYKHTLPVEIAEQCFALTKAYGLNFSTSDFILTPDGRYVFLEMNPNGQFLWVQDAVPELKMKEALAACLIRGSNA